MRFIDLTGRRFSRLTVTGLAPASPGRGVRWLCRCDCGGWIVATTWELRSGRIVSCGCLEPQTAGVPDGPAVVPPNLDRAAGVRLAA